MWKQAPCMLAFVAVAWLAALPANGQMRSTGQTRSTTTGTSTNGFGTQQVGQFGGGSFIGTQQSAGTTAQAVRQQATGTGGTAFATGDGSSILGGAMTTTTTGTRGGMGMNMNSLGTLGAMGMMGRGGGFGGQFGGQFGNQFQNQLGNTNNQTSVRVPIRVGSELLALRNPEAVRTLTTTAFARRLTRLPGLERANSVSVVLEGRTAVVRGAVSSQRERDQIERLLMLEPGVSRVQNELLVTSLPEPAPLPSP